MAAGAQAPGLSFLRSLNWVEAPVVTEDTALHQMLAALKGETLRQPRRHCGSSFIPIAASKR